MSCLPAAAAVVLSFCSTVSALTAATLRSRRQRWCGTTGTQTLTLATGR
jgi:hypothetical protein